MCVCVCVCVCVCFYVLIDVCLCFLLCEGVGCSHATLRPRGIDVCASWWCFGIGCDGSFAPSTGLLQLTVGGQSSAPFPINYQHLLSIPILFEGLTSPPQCPTDGCVVTLSGSGVQGCEVLVSNALGNSVLQPLASTDDTLTVRRLRSVSV